MGVGATRGAAEPGRVEQAIRSAASATGVDFAYLLKTARRESSLNPAAKARTSSASGLFQFIEQTWLGTLKKHGAEHGYGKYAAMIERGSDGRYRVAGEAARQSVLDLRFDAKASSLMAAELTSDHAAYLKGRIGREPTSGELYVAHFMGPAGSAKLILANERSPGATAANLFPAAARANRPIFYEKGRALSVAEVYADLTKQGGATAAAPAERTPETRAILAAAAAQPEAVATDAAGVGAAYAALTSRYDRARRDSLLIDLFLGEGARGVGAASPLSAELLTLLSAGVKR